MIPGAMYAERFESSWPRGMEVKWHPFLRPAKAASIELREAQMALRSPVFIPRPCLRHQAQYQPSVPPAPSTSQFYNACSRAHRQEQHLAQLTHRHGIPAIAKSQAEVATAPAFHQHRSSITVSLPVCSGAPCHHCCFTLSLSKSLSKPSISKS